MTTRSAIVALMRVFLEKIYESGAALPDRFDMCEEILAKITDRELVSARGINVIVDRIVGSPTQKELYAVTWPFLRALSICCLLRHYEDEEIKIMVHFNWIMDDLSFTANALNNKRHRDLEGMIIVSRIFSDIVGS